MKHIFLLVLFFSLILGCSNSKIENNEDELFTDKDFFRVAPVDLSLHREMEKIYFEFGDISPEGITLSERDQTLFRAY